MAVTKKLMLTNDATPIELPVKGSGVCSYRLKDVRARVEYCLSADTPLADGPWHPLVADSLQEFNLTDVERMWFRVKNSSVPVTLAYTEAN